MPASQRDIERIRKQMAAQMSGRPKDPFEFTCPTVNDNEVVNYRYYVLDGLKKGDMIATSTTTFLEDGDKIVYKVPFDPLKN